MLRITPDALGHDTIRCVAIDWGWGVDARQGREQRQRFQLRWSGGTCASGSSVAGDSRSHERGAGGDVAGHNSKFAVKHTRMNPSAKG